MTDVISVLANLEGNATGMLKAFDSSAKGAERMAGNAAKASSDAESRFNAMEGNVGKTLKRIGGVLAATFTVGAIAAFGKGAIDAASDLQEAGTAVEAVFGPSMGTIQAWAEGAAGAMGQSTLQALDAAKSFGVYGSQAGLAADANADFSMKLTGLASDLASFHNADPSEVIEALGAGLRGEAEPLRKYGILMNDASLQAAALAAGISDGSTPLTQQQKILAANALIMEQAGAAAGDFARTQDGLANQTRIAGANWTNLSATIGSAFLPVIQTGAQLLNTLVFPALQKMAETVGGLLGPAMDTVSGKISQFGSVAQGVFAILFQGDFDSGFFEGLQIAEDSPIVDVLFTVRESFQQMWSTVQPIVSELAGTLGPVFLDLAAQILPLITQLSPLMAILTALQPVFPQIASVAAQLAETLGSGLAAILPTVADVIGTLAEVLSGALAAALPPIVSIVEMLAGVFEMVMPVVVEIAGVVGDVLATALSAVAPLFGALLPVISKLLSSLTPIIPPILKIVSAFLPLIEVVGELIGAILPPLIDLLMAVLGPILDLISPILDLLTPAIDFLSDALSGLIGWIADGIKWLIDLATGGGDSADQLGDAFTWLWENAISPAIDGISGAIRFVQNLIGGAFAVIGNVVNSLGNVFQSVFSSIGGFISDAFNNAVGIVRGAINGIIGLANGAISALNGISVTIPDFIPGIGGQTFGIDLPNIPYLAKGGDVTAPGLSWVGEAGPELLYLPQGAQVTPLARVGNTSSTEGLGGDGDGGAKIVNHWHVQNLDPAEVAKFTTERQRWQLEADGVDLGDVA